MDRELLELAAKAADIPVVFGGLDGETCRRSDTWELWNSLTDDGDALRLAAHLGILLRTDFVRRLADLLRATVEHRAATRRAITEIAAEIGKLKLTRAA